MSAAFKHSLASLAAAALLVGCAVGDSGASAVAGAAPLTAAMEGQTAPDGTAIQCRSMQVTGSRFPVRECKSEKAWQEFDNQMAENAKNETDKFQRVRSGCSVSGTC